MITAKTVKYTRTNKTMAFITVEDLVGTVEVVIFPRDYEQFRGLWRRTIGLYPGQGVR